MPDVNFKTDALKPCRCGFKPDHYTVSYGPEPYIVFCPVCVKQNWKGIGGWFQNIIDHYNNEVADKTVEELKAEAKADYERRKQERIDNY